MILGYLLLLISLWLGKYSMAILTSFSQGGKIGMSNWLKCFLKKHHNRLGIILAPSIFARDILAQTFHLHWHFGTHTFRTQWCWHGDVMALRQCHNVPTPKHPRFQNVPAPKFQVPESPRSQKVQLSKYLGRQNVSAEMSLAELLHSEIIFLRNSLNQLLTGTEMLTGQNTPSTLKCILSQWPRTRKHHIIRPWSWRLILALNGHFLNLSSNLKWFFLLW